MYAHSQISVLIVDDNQIENIKLLAAYLKKIPHLQLDVHHSLPKDLSTWRTVVTAVGAMSEENSNQLEAHVSAGFSWFNILHPSISRICRHFGAQPGQSGPMSELRILFSEDDHPLSKRLPDFFYVTQYYHPLVLNSGDVETILYTDWHHQHYAVLVKRHHGDGIAVCTTLQDYSRPILCQIIYRLIRHLDGMPMEEGHLGVGILGYAPSVGKLHGQGVFETPGLELKAACDMSPKRLQGAQVDFPAIKIYDSAKDFGNDPDVDLVIIATPPNSHAKLSLEMIEAGKHVVCEKPLALNQAETTAMAEAAYLSGVHLSCHQNRRWDVDYLAIKQVLSEGLIGTIFYLETFVGGFQHPCGYWHSHKPVSGGTAYDWGAHYIDWIVSLFGGRIQGVIGTRHKRVWQDITNADQVRIQIRFEEDREAEFIHSDIAAVRKPKWYVLGSAGAITGHWNDVTQYQIEPLHYFKSNIIPATEMPPDLTIYRRHDDNQITVMKPAIPKREIFGFHRNLADHLLTGEPLVAPLEDSMRVTAVLEAANRSMENGGSLEVLDV